MFPTIQGEVRSPDLIAKLTRAQATVTTVTKERNASNVVELFLPTAADASQIVSTALTETRFNNSGMERKTTSDFGFIGWIIAQVEES